VSARKSPKKWIANVTTDSTHPPEGLFTKSAPTIARVLASKKVSPKGPVSGLRMLTYFINRGGKGLTSGRLDELEKAKALLSSRVRRERKPSSPPKKRNRPLKGRTSG
jgi:tRNA(adenine34) deaminase